MVKLCSRVADPEPAETIRRDDNNNDIAAMDIIVIALLLLLFVESTKVCRWDRRSVAGEKKNAANSPTDQPHAKQFN